MKSYLILCIVLLLSTVSFAQKLKVEDVLAKHLEATGSTEEFSKLKNQIAVGIVKFTVLRAGGEGGDGRIALVSEDRKLLLSMRFEIPSYPNETIIFDGKDYKIAFPQNNVRSAFGNYLYQYFDVIKEGLLGGTLSTGWALRRLSETKAKVSLNGTKEIKLKNSEERDAYVVEYIPKNGSDLEIRIFIDKETFQHLRTEYRRVISAPMGATPELSASRRERREVLVEDFADYKKVGAFALPHSYKIYLLIDGQTRTNEYEWEVSFFQFLFNQKLEENFFDLQ